MEAKERIETLRNQRKIYIDRPKTPLGGQSCGMPIYPTVIEHEGLNIKISIGFNRSNYKNRELAISIFDLAFDELVK